MFQDAFEQGIVTGIKLMEQKIHMHRLPNRSIMKYANTLPRQNMMWQPVSS